MTATYGGGGVSAKGSGMTSAWLLGAIAARTSFRVLDSHADLHHRPASRRLRSDLTGLSIAARAAVRRRVAARGVSVRATDDVQDRPGGAHGDVAAGLPALVGRVGRGRLDGAVDEQREAVVGRCGPEQADQLALARVGHRPVPGADRGDLAVPLHAGGGGARALVVVRGEEQRNGPETRRHLEELLELDLHAHGVIVGALPLTSPRVKTLTLASVRS